MAPLGLSSLLNGLDSSTSTLTSKCAAPGGSDIPPLGLSKHSPQYNAHSGGEIFQPHTPGTQAANSTSHSSRWTSFLGFLGDNSSGNSGSNRGKRRGTSFEGGENKESTVTNPGGAKPEGDNPSPPSSDKPVDTLPKPEPAKPDFDKNAGKLVFDLTKKMPKAEEMTDDDLTALSQQMLDLTKGKEMENIQNLVDGEAAKAREAIESTPLGQVIMDIGGNGKESTDPSVGRWLGTSTKTPPPLSKRVDQPGLRCADSELGVSTKKHPSAKESTNPSGGALTANIDSKTVEALQKAVEEAGWEEWATLPPPPPQGAIASQSVTGPNGRQDEDSIEGNSVEGNSVESNLVEGNLVEVLEDLVDFLLLSSSSSRPMSTIGELLERTVWSHDFVRNERLPVFEFQTEGAEGTEGPAERSERNSNGNFTHKTAPAQSERNSTGNFSHKAALQETGLSMFLRRSVSRVQLKFLTSEVNSGFRALRRWYKSALLRWYKLVRPTESDYTIAPGDVLLGYIPTPAVEKQRAKNLKLFSPYHEHLESWGFGGINKEALEERVLRNRDAFVYQYRELTFGENALTSANLVRWVLTFGFSRFLIPSFLKAVTAAIVCINGVEVNGPRTVGTTAVALPLALRTLIVALARWAVEAFVLLKQVELVVTVLPLVILTQPPLIWIPLLWVFCATLIERNSTSIAALKPGEHISRATVEKRELAKS